jgi:hypothetical protein
VDIPLQIQPQVIGTAEKVLSAVSSISAQFCCR